MRKSVTVLLPLQNHSFHMQLHDRFLALLGHLDRTGVGLSLCSGEHLLIVALL